MAEYWCMVALNYDRDEAFVVGKSEDAIADCIFDDTDFLYQYGDDWLKNEHGPGLYRLTVRFPVDDDGVIDLDDDFTFQSVECLSEFPPLVSTKAADEFETINQRMQEIAAREGSFG
jgi:hypothetical protein